MASKNFKRPNPGEHVENKETMPNGKSFENITTSGRPITAVQLDNEIAAVDAAFESVEGQMNSVVLGALPGAGDNDNENKLLMTDGGGNLSWVQVSNEQLSDKSVTSSKIVDSSIKENHLDGSSVTENKIKNKAITEHKIDDNAIKTSQIKDGAVTHDKLAADAVKGAHLSDNEITTSHIKDGQITGDKLGEIDHENWVDKIKPDVEPNPDTIPKRDDEGSLKGKSFIYSDEEDDLEDLSSVIVCKDDKKSVPLKLDKFKEKLDPSANEPFAPYYRLSPNQEGVVKDNQLVGFTKTTNFQVDFEVIRRTEWDKEWASRDTEEQAIFNAMGIQPTYYSSFNIIKVKWSGWTTGTSGWLFYSYVGKNSGYITSACYAKLISGAVDHHLFGNITNNWSLCGEVFNARSIGYNHPHPMVSSATGEVHFFLPATIAGKFPLDKNNPKLGWVPYNPNIDDANSAYGIIDLIYPVGSIWTTMSDNNPPLNNVLGIKWNKMDEGYALMSGSTSSRNAGSQGLNGSTNPHALTIAQLPTNIPLNLTSSASLPLYANNNASHGYRSVYGLGNGILGMVNKFNANTANNGPVNVSVSGTANGSNNGHSHGLDIKHHKVVVWERTS